MQIEARWYNVRALPPLDRQEPPPSDHPQYEKIVAIQEAAFAKKLAGLKPALFRMWGPQIAFLLAGQPYEIVEDECAPK